MQCWLTFFKTQIIMKTIFFRFFSPSKDLFHFLILILKCFFDVTAFDNYHISMIIRLLIYAIIGFPLSFYLHSIT